MLIFLDAKNYMKNNISKGELLGTSRSGCGSCTIFLTAQKSCKVGKLGYGHIFNEIISKLTPQSGFS